MLKIASILISVELLEFVALEFPVAKLFNSK